MNPMRMLGESISFGRFMSEGLDWERWSAFSHNRYVEEAEKYSKPGSVAAKKAYFEAHYKRKAKEKAAALIQEANARANGTFDPETQEGNCTNLTVEMKSEADSIVAVNEQPDKDAVNYQVVDDDDDDTNQYKCHVEPNDLDISNVEGVEDVGHTCVDTNLNVENCVLVDNSNKEIAIPVEERIPDPVIFCSLFLFISDFLLFLLISKFVSVATQNIYPTDAAGHCRSRSFGFASQEKRS